MLAPFRSSRSKRVTYAAMALGWTLTATFGLLFVYKPRLIIQKQIIYLPNDADSGHSKGNGAYVPDLKLSPDDDPETLRHRAEDLQAAGIQSEEAIKKLKRHCLKRAEETSEPTQRAQFKALADRLERAQKAARSTNEILDPNVSSQEDSQ